MQRRSCHVPAARPIASSGTRTREAVVAPFDAPGCLGRVGSRRSDPATAIGAPRADSTRCTALFQDCRRYDQPPTKRGNWFAFDRDSKKLQFRCWQSIDGSVVRGLCSRPVAVLSRSLRARPEITESTFDRVRYGFTTCLGYHML